MSEQSKLPFSMLDKLVTRVRDDLNKKHFVFIYKPREMIEETKESLRKVLSAFIEQYKFQLMELSIENQKETIQT